MNVLNLSGGDDFGSFSGVLIGADFGQRDVLPGVRAPRSKLSTPIATINFFRIAII